MGQHGEAGEGRGFVPRTWSSIVLWLSAALVPGLVLLLRGMPIGDLNSGQDADFAIRMQRHVMEQLQATGTWPLRWLWEGNDGFGSPALYFYPQLGFLFAALWQKLLGTGPDRALAIALLLARLIAFAGAYAWVAALLRSPDGSGPREAGERASLAALGAALFLLTPQLSVNGPLQRSAFAEMTGLAWIPLVFLAIDAQGKGWTARTRVLLGAAAFAALALTHVLQAMLIGPLALLYAAARHGLPRAALTLAAGGLGAALAAVNLLPALALQDWTAHENWTQLFFHKPAYSTLFGAGHFRTMKELAGWPNAAATYATWLACAAAGLLLLRARGGWRGMARGERGLVLVLALGLAAMTWPAAPLWEISPHLAKVQFPWRYLTGMSLLAAGAAVLAMTSPWPARRVLARVLPLLALLSALGVGTLAIADQLLPTGTWLGRRWMLPQFAASSAERLAREAGRAAKEGEYIPRAAADAGWVMPPIHGELTPEVSHARTAMAEPMALVGEAEVRLLRQGARNPSFVADAPGGAVIRLPVLYWPALRAGAPAGRGAELPLEADPATGLLLLRVPPGQTRGELTIVRTLPERAGAAVSVAALGVWLSLAVLVLVQARQRRASSTRRSAEGPY